MNIINKVHKNLNVIKRNKLNSYKGYQDLISLSICSSSSFIFFKRSVMDISSLSLFLFFLSVKKRPSPVQIKNPEMLEINIQNNLVSTSPIRLQIYHTVFFKIKLVQNKKAPSLWWGLYNFNFYLHLKISMNKPHECLLALMSHPAIFINRNHDAKIIIIVKYPKYF